MTAPSRLHVLHVVSEVAPFSKTGGLGDVASALPRALARAGLRVTIVTPRYRTIDPQRFALARRLAPLLVTFPRGTESVTVYEGSLPGGGVSVYFLDHPLYDREGLYGDGGADYPDNGLRFALLARGALELMNQLGTWPDIVHAHDWQAGLAPVFARRGSVAGHPAPASIMTVHNLAFQGLAPKSLVDEIGLGWDLFSPDVAEYFDQLSLLKAGLAFADRITTVSPRYAREIQTPEFGAGLHGFLAKHASRIVGVLNGVDPHVWDPAGDPFLAARYDADRFAGKAACKVALQRELRLPPRPQTALIGAVSRLTEQKGLDLIAGAAEELARLDAQFVFLGTGEKRFETALEGLARRHPAKLAARIAYDEPLAHRILAGADLFLLPSRWEPCGLTQLYSLRYGTVPIVRAVGGLDDTVVDWDERTATGTGFKFWEYDEKALVGAVRTALATFGKRDLFTMLAKRGMKLDYSWDASARRYRELYESLTRKTGDGVRAA